ncbi:MAG: hypothetical protein HY225_01010 [Candidatus Vogelbacteria bacterium]|nr:hypothetical protein [Candidatus Vogelbacteria bacterium]
MNNIITIPHALAKNDDLVVIPRKQYEYFLQVVGAEDEILSLSRGAQVLKKKGKLPVLKSLRSLR